MNWWASEGVSGDVVVRSPVLQSRPLWGGAGVREALEVRGVGAQKVSGWDLYWPSSGACLEMKVCRNFIETCVLSEPLSFWSEHKICLVGLDNAGKTTILYQFLMNEVVHTSPTIGSNVEEVSSKDIIVTVAHLIIIQQVVWNNIHFVMWDLGGQESLRTAWNTYYSNTEFIILVGLPPHPSTNSNLNISL